MAFAQMEPFGAEVNFLGHAITAATVANSSRQKGSRVFEIKDFMPEFERREQTVDEMLQFAQAITLGLGGQDLREDG